MPRTDRDLGLEPEARRQIRRRAQRPFVADFDDIDAARRIALDQLVQQANNVGILAQATRGKPERTARYRDLLEPSGIPHELRAAFVRRGRVWGVGEFDPAVFDVNDYVKQSQVDDPSNYGPPAQWRFQLDFDF